MRLSVEFFERAPMVWLLLGLLMIACGLYLGFDHPLTIYYMLIGIACSLYGPLLFAFKRREQRTRKPPRPLSRDFISVGSTIMPASDEDEADQRRMAERRASQAEPDQSRSH